MKRLLTTIGLVLTVWLAAPAAAQERDREIEGVIAAQIEAFRSNDLPEAFTYASPMIQRMFVNPEKFGVMVRNGYPMVWRPAEVTMGKLRVQGERVFQDVLLRDGTGTLYIAEYEMIRLDGRWRINGVRLRKPELQGV